MINLNKLQIVGRVTKQPELKTFDSGAVLCSFSIATNHTYKNKAGEKIEETEFHNITSFGKMAETIARYVIKGQELYVCGRVKTDTYEKEGQKHYSTKIILENFQFGAKPKGAENNEQGQTQTQEAPKDAFNEAMESKGKSSDEIKPEDIPF